MGRLPLPVQVAELGSGSGKKTRWILEALARKQRTYYYPIEISPSALAACEKEMNQIDLVSVVGYEKNYLDGLRAVASRREEADHLLVLFLGSSIGNFDRDAGDSFLGRLGRLGPLPRGRGNGVRDPAVSAAAGWPLSLAVSMPPTAPTSA